MPSGLLACFALSCENSAAGCHGEKFPKFSEFRACLHAHVTTALKHRFGRLGVGNYTVAFLTRFALSCENSATGCHREKFPKFSEFRVCLHAHVTTALKHRFGRLEVGNYTVAFLTRFALSCENSATGCHGEKLICIIFSFDIKNLCVRILILCC